MVVFDDGMLANVDIPVKMSMDERGGVCGGGDLAGGGFSYD